MSITETGRQLEFIFNKNNEFEIRSNIQWPTKEQLDEYMWTQQPDPTEGTARQAVAKMVSDGKELVKEKPGLGVGNKPQEVFYIK